MWSYGPLYHLGCSLDHMESSPRSYGLSSRSYGLSSRSYKRSSRSSGHSSFLVLPNALIFTASDSRLVTRHHVTKFPPHHLRRIKQNINHKEEKNPETMITQTQCTSCHILTINADSYIQPSSQTRAPSFTLLRLCQHLPIEWGRSYIFLHQPECSLCFPEKINEYNEKGCLN